MKAGIPARVGACFAGVQFCLAGCWALQALYLPALVAQAGWPRSATVWLLMAEQAILVVSDFAMGFAADRLASRSGRVGPALLGVTLVSCGVFVLLPVAAAGGSGPALLALLAVWAATSSASRAPPFQLIGRHAAVRSQPWLIGMSMFGYGMAGAIAPSAAMALRDVGPHGPFVVGGAALALAALGIVAAERLLVRAGSADAFRSPVGRVATPSIGAAAAVPGGGTGRRGVLVVAALAALAAATAYQVHVAVNSAPLYRRLAGPADVVYLMPVFWAGFCLFLLPATRLIGRAGALAVTTGGALLAAVVSLLVPWVGGLQLLVNLQFIVGCAWACTMFGSAAAALALGRPGQEGRFSGALVSLFALAALARTALESGGPERAHGTAWLGAFPVCGWAAAGLLAWVLQRRRAFA